MRPSDYIHDVLIGAMVIFIGLAMFNVLPCSESTVDIDIQFSAEEF